MPFIISGRRRRRVLAGAIGFAALIATPAHAAGSLTNPYDCAPHPQLSETFSAWNDDGQYTPVANQGVEDGAANWTLSGGAAIVSGNEPWMVGGASDTKSLDLPAGSSAITAPLCIDETYPYFRLFARNAGSPNAAMKIEVLYYNRQGGLLSTKPFRYAASSTAWQPTGMVGIGVFARKTTVDAAPVAFRFTPTGNTAHYQIDDVYVDPWARG
jgi:hypothetical protein